MSKKFVDWTTLLIFTLLFWLMATTLDTINQGSAMAAEHPLDRLGVEVDLSSANQAISNVQISNVRDTSFTVSWITDQASTGTVQYGTDANNLNQTANDDRGPSTSDDTHHVTITGLTPSTTYYFDVVSGSTTDNNSGNHYTVTTGPSLSLSSSDTVYGQVFKSDGTTAAEGTIVYVALQDNDSSGSSGQSAQLSALVDSDGYWVVNLGNMRTSDLSASFSYSSSGDQLVMQAQGAADGSASQTVDTASDTPAASMTLAPTPTPTPTPASAPAPAPTATPSNQPPSVTPIPDITVIEGAADQTINPLNYFSDPEGDVFLLSVTGNSNPSVVPNLPEGHFLGNIDQMAIQFGQVGQTEITLQAKEVRSNATVEDTFSVTVLQRPSISIEKGVSDASVEAGQRISYTIAITNSGPSTATDALISDALPAGLTFVADSIRASGITTGTVGSTPPTLASGVTLAVNQTINLSFAATVSDTLLANQTISNSVQLTSTEVITPVIASNLITTMAPTLAISDVTVAEGDGNASFTVKLAKASAIPVMVEYSSAMGSATAEDCVPTNGTLTIAAGDTEGVITMQIIDDALPEGDESFTMQLSNPTNATISDGEAVGTITDNDDADGIDNDMEDLVPNLLGSGTGDGNGDGIPDSQQDNVASLPNGTNGDYVTFAVADNQSLTGVQAASTPADAPQEASFSQGIFSWNATGLSAGDATSITLILHSSDSANLPNSYWKFGPTPDNPTAHWYNFTFDAQTGTGAQIDGNTITLHFVDGQRGDSDMTANGQISDPGGPAMYAAPTALTLTDIGSQAPITRHAGALLALLLVAGGLFIARRRKEA